MVKLNWITEITHVKEGDFFVDEQRFGPYRFWHHKHFFNEVPGGMRCVDEVHYLPPCSLISPIINSLIVSKRLKNIFDYRTAKLESIFGVMDSWL